MGNEKQPQLGEQEDEQQVKKSDVAKAILGKFDEKEEEHIKRLEDLFEKRISRSKAEKVAGEMSELKREQQQGVRDTFAKFKKSFEEKSDADISEREKMAQQLLNQAETEVTARIQNIEIILNLLVKGDYITSEEAVALKRILSGVEKISAKDVESEKILSKLSKRNSGEKLESSDYKHIINMINPLDLTSSDATPKQHFDATNAGILIGFMTGAERYKLIQEMMDHPKRDQTGEVIDAFLRTGILTVAQGEELFKEGLEKKVIKQSEFESTYRDRIDKGFYVEEVKKTQQALKDASHQMDKMYDNSLVERIAGGSLVGTGLALHSFFWLLTNLLAAQGDFKSLLHNPYVWAAIGEAALAAEIIPGSLKIGSGNLGIGSGWVTRLYEKISEKEGKLSTAKENSYKVIGEIYLNYTDLGGYLENGGAQTIHNLRAEKSAGGSKGAELLISVDELLAAEKDPIQQGRLKHAIDKFPKQTYQQINAIGEALTVLEIDNQATFNAKLQYIKDEQGLKNSPTPTITPGTQPQEPLKDVPS